MKKIFFFVRLLGLLLKRIQYSFRTKDSFDHRINVLINSGDQHGWAEMVLWAMPFVIDKHVLSVASGDGFFERNYFSGVCLTVDCYDSDPSARMRFEEDKSKKNVRFISSMPAGEQFYDVILFFYGFVVSRDFPGAYLQQVFNQFNLNLKKGGCVLAYFEVDEHEFPSFSLMVRDSGFHLEQIFCDFRKKIFIVLRKC